MEKCIACGMCAEKCPKKVEDLYNESLITRKAIYVPYSQAVPLKYTIDAENCIYFTKGKCRACEKFCPAGAINFKEEEKTLTLQVGSLILALGFTSFDPARFDTYAYAQLPDVVTSLEFERILSTTGPYEGHLLRPSSMRGKHPEGKAPRKIAWLQCVGSRDINRCDNGYCSSVCCMYAVKQAVMAKDHSDSGLDCAIFYMDMRTQGKDFDRYYENAKAGGVRFIPAKIHTVEPVSGSDDLLMRYLDEDGRNSSETFDMVVLSTGIEVGRESVALSKTLGIETRCIPLHPQRQFPSGKHLGTGDLCLRRLYRAQGYPPVGHGGQCRGLRCHRKPGGGPQHPDPSGGHPGGKRCEPETAKHRGVCLQLRHQYRGNRQGTGGRRICQEPARRRIRGRKPVYLFPGYSGQALGRHPSA